MKFLKDVSKFMQAQRSMEDSLYASVLDEVISGMVMKDLWARSMTYGDFDPDKTRSFYIRERVSRLKKKSKAINEYLKLVGLESEINSVNTKEKRRYAIEFEAYHQSLKQLEEQHQSTVNQITEEQSALAVKQDEAFTTIRADARDSAPKRAHERKMYLIGGAVAVGVTCLAVMFGAPGIISFFIGLIAILSLASGLMNTNEEESQIEAARKALKEASSLLSLHTKRQGIVDQVLERRGKAPELILSSSNFNGARKQELETELYSLFNLEPISAS